MAKKLLGQGSLAILMAMGLLGTSTPAKAERYLFDILFGNRDRREVRTTPPPQLQSPAVPRVATNNGRQGPRPAATSPKITGPSYHDYQPKPRVKVDFAALSDTLLRRHDGTSGPSSQFEKALSGLSDFDLLAEKEVADALIKYYSKNPAFIWVDGDKPNGKAKAVLRVLGDASAFGLTESDYVIDPPAGSIGTAQADEKRPAALIRFEMTLSARALRYARDAHLGRVDPNKLSGYHDFPQKKLEEQRVLKVLAGTAKPVAYLEALHPQNELYTALVGELKALRESQEREIVVAPDTFVRPGASHPEFSKIMRIIERDADSAFRAEHGELLASYGGSEIYARELVPVIKAAQKRHDLNPDGVIGRQTIGALAGESRFMRIQKVLLALERLRWHPSRLGSTRVMLNVPSFTASFMRDGQEKLSMRTVVGTPSNQTNFFFDEVEYVEFNPYWGVPRSILVNEMLPKLRRDPSYLDRLGYEVTNGRGQRVSSSSVNWWVHGANVPYHVRQKPGSSNALGELKIMFPNRHSIYMHDTPQKSLFSRDTRAYSHGCVRLEDPRAMAAAVLDTSVEEIAQAVAAGRNSRKNAPRKFPVYVSYFTAWPESAGGVSYHPDIYGRDDHLAKALAKVEEARAQKPEARLASGLDASQ